MEGGSQSVPSPSSLLRCEEDLGSLDEEIVEDDDCDDDDDGYIRTLLEREITIGGSHLQEFLQNSSIQRARSEGIHYVLRVSFYLSVCVEIVWNVFDERFWHFL